MTPVCDECGVAAATHRLDALDLCDGCGLPADGLAAPVR